MKPQLLVQETLTTIRVDWENAPDITDTRWNSTKWQHPDCTILYSRLSTVRRSNYEAVANTIMCALQDAGLSVRSLRYYGHSMRRGRKYKVDKSQGRLL